MGDNYIFTPEQVADSNHDATMADVNSSAANGLVITAGAIGSLFGGWIVIDKINGMRHRRR